MSGDEQDLQVLRHRISVHLQLLGDVRDSKTFGSEFEEIFDLGDFVLIQNMVRFVHVMRTVEGATYEHMHGGAAMQ